MGARVRSAAPALLLALGALCLFQSASAIVTLPALTPWGPTAKAPVTQWLLSNDATIIPFNDKLAWQKLGSKIWTFLSNLDHDFVDAAGKTVPPALAAQRVFGPAITCGRFASIFARMVLNDCSTFDVGAAGSFGDTGTPRFGCNGSLRWELAQCLAAGPECVNGYEAAIDLATGVFLPETAFASLELKYGAANVPTGFDLVHDRVENAGFQNALAFLYQLQQETLVDEPLETRLPVLSLADVIAYAGSLAVAKCSGPHVLFHPGRLDSLVFDDPARLPTNPALPVFENFGYSWVNGLTNFDTVNLMSLHSIGCSDAFGCLDNTPRLFDADWAAQLLTVTSGTDPRICQLPVLSLPPPPAVELCLLPADVEFNTRQDVRNYLLALTGQMTILDASNVLIPCLYQLGVPVVAGQTCDVGPGAALLEPFKLVILKKTGGSVNLCARTDPLVDRLTCPVGPAVIPNHHDAFASSFFKLQALWVDVAGLVVGTDYGVARQRCQPGLQQVGYIPPVVAAPGPVKAKQGVQPVLPLSSVPNPVCLCCPLPPVQEWTALPAVPVAPI